MQTLDLPAPTREAPVPTAAVAVRGNTTPAAPTAPGAPQEVLSFRLGSEEYGIDILRVQEIRSFEPCTRIAGAPSFIKGVVNLRGVIVPIVDLRLKFGLAEAALDGNTVTIVLNVSQRVVGVVVDSVSDVLQLKAEQIQPAPEFNSTVAASHITGIATVMQGELQRMLVLIDIEQLMASDEMGLVDRLAH
jgi:purine-binding chemotaxis protein CheW